MTIPRFLLIAGLLLGTILGVLAFGNPQWNPWIYKLQAKYVYNSPYRLLVSPKSYKSNNLINCAYIDPPKRYTGEWKHWSQDGILLGVEQYLDGVPNGDFKYFDLKGRLIVHQIRYGADQAKFSETMPTWSKSISYDTFKFRKHNISRNELTRAWPERLGANQFEITLEYFDDRDVLVHKTIQTGPKNQTLILYEYQRGKMINISATWNNKSAVIYDPTKTIDRRAEFRIEVE